MWYSRTITDEIEMRVRQIIAYYRDRIRLTGIDKASGPPYDANKIRHNHVHPRRLDPIIMYQFFPATPDNPVPRLHFVTPTTHNEAFRGNEMNFNQHIRQFLGESKLAATAA
jgi:hypothetical protein